MLSQRGPRPAPLPARTRAADASRASTTGHRGQGHILFPEGASPGYKLQSCPLQGLSPTISLSLFLHL